MQINNNGELLISINGKTKLLSKEVIVKLYNQDISSITINDTIKDSYPYFVSHTAESYPNSIQEEVTAPAHYNNEKGSLYEFCERNGINSYEFDIIKRVMRCRKKGLFKEDLEKTKFLIDLYLKEYQ
jgi:hypothetical protein